MAILISTETVTKVANYLDSKPGINFPSDNSKIFSRSRKYSKVKIQVDIHIFKGGGSYNSGDIKCNYTKLSPLVSQWGGGSYKSGDIKFNYTNTLWRYFIGCHIICIFISLL